MCGRASGDPRRISLRMSAPPRGYGYLLALEWVRYSAKIGASGQDDAILKGKHRQW